MQTRQKLKIMKLTVIIALFFVVSGCDDGAQSTSSTNNNSLKQLEQKELIPELDRSDDIAGPDTDGNGVRDDIDLWIAKQDITNLQKKALTQEARSIQYSLLADVNDQDILRQAHHIMLRAIKCTGQHFEQINDNRGYHFSKKLEKLTVNTKQRFEQYQKFSAASSGSVFRLLEGETCDE